LPHIAVSLRAVPFGNGWHKPVGERWYGCSLRRWLRSAQMKRGLLRITATYPVT
jgi:hypothetical protein